MSRPMPALTSDPAIPQSRNPAIPPVDTARKGKILKPAREAYTRQITNARSCALVVDSQDSLHSCAELAHTLPR